MQVIEDTQTSPDNESDDGTEPRAELVYLEYSGRGEVFEHRASPDIIVDAFPSICEKNKEIWNQKRREERHAARRTQRYIQEQKRAQDLQYRRKTNSRSKSASRFFCSPSWSSSSSSFFSLHNRQKRGPREQCKSKEERERADIDGDIKKMLFSSPHITYDLHIKIWTRRVTRITRHITAFANHITSISSKLGHGGKRRKISSHQTSHSKCSDTQSRYPLQIKKKIAEIFLSQESPNQVRIEEMGTQSLESIKEVKRLLRSFWRTTQKDGIQWSKAHCAFSASVQENGLPEEAKWLLSLRCIGLRDLTRKEKIPWCVLWRDKEGETDTITTIFHPSLTLDDSLVRGTDFSATHAQNASSLRNMADYEDIELRKQNYLNQVCAIYEEKDEEYSRDSSMPSHSANFPSVLEIEDTEIPQQQQQQRQQQQSADKNSTDESDSRRSCSGRDSQERPCGLFERAEYGSHFFSYWTKFPGAIGTNSVLTIRSSLVRVKRTVDALFGSFPFLRRCHSYSAAFDTTAHPTVTCGGKAKSALSLLPWVGEDPVRPGLIQIVAPREQLAGIQILSELQRARQDSNYCAFIPLASYLICDIAASPSCKDANTLHIPDYSFHSTFRFARRDTGFANLAAHEDPRSWLAPDLELERRDMESCTRCVPSRDVALYAFVAYLSDLCGAVTPPHIPGSQGFERYRDLPYLLYSLESIIREASREEMRRFIISFIEPTHRPYEVDLSSVSTRWLEYAGNNNIRKRIYHATWPFEAHSKSALLHHCLYRILADEARTGNNTRNNYLEEEDDDGGDANHCDAHFDRPTLTLRAKRAIFMIQRKLRRSPKTHPRCFPCATSATPSIPNAFEKQRRERRLDQRVTTDTSFRRGLALAFSILRAFCYLAPEDGENAATSPFVPDHQIRLLLECGQDGEPGMKLGKCIQLLDESPLPHFCADLSDFRRFAFWRSIDGYGKDSDNSSCSPHASNAYNHHYFSGAHHPSNQEEEEEEKDLLGDSHVNRYASKYGLSQKQECGDGDDESIENEDTECIFMNTTPFNGKHENATLNTSSNVVISHFEQSTSEENKTRKKTRKRKREEEGDTMLSEDADFNFPCSLM